MTAHEHVGEQAELYALGTLDEAQRAAVDEHARGCDSCAARLGRAEATVAEMIDPVAPSGQLDRRVTAAFAKRRAGWKWTGSLVAAAFVAGLLPAIAMWTGSFQANQSDSNREAIVQAMVTGHFAHAPFIARTTDAPAAKLIYGRARDWRYVVAKTSRPYALAERIDGRTIVLGRLHVTGNAGELYIAHAGSAREFVLLDGARVLARVMLPYRP